MSIVRSDRLMGGLTVAGALAVLLLIPVPETEARQDEVRPTAAQPTEAQPPAARPPEARPLEADRELLRHTMTGARIVTDRSRPGLAQWASDAGIAFSRWLAGWMERVLPGFTRLWAPFLEPALMVLLALLAALLLAFLVRFALQCRRRARARVPDPAVQHLGAADGPAATRHWEGELRRRLARGDVAAATRALWWWLASRLVADRAEPSWTSRELVARAGRRDLRAEVRRLDRMMYGAARPRAIEVGDLWDDLREAVG